VLFCLLLAAFRAANPAVAIIEWHTTTEGIHDSQAIE
jgi:hypothetical protein